MLHRYDDDDDDDDDFVTLTTLCVLMPVLLSCLTATAGILPNWPRGSRLATQWLDYYKLSFNLSTAVRCYVWSFLRTTCRSSPLNLFVYLCMHKY